MMNGIIVKTFFYLFKKKIVDSWKISASDFWQIYTFLENPKYNFFVFMCVRATNFMGDLSLEAEFNQSPDC